MLFCIILERTSQRKSACCVKSNCAWLAHGFTHQSEIDTRRNYSNSPMQVNPTENRQIHTSTSPDLQRTKGARCNGIMSLSPFSFLSLSRRDQLNEYLLSALSSRNITPISEAKAFISPLSAHILFLYLSHERVSVAQKQRRITGVVNKDSSLISSAY